MSSFYFHIRLLVLIYLSLFSVAVHKNSKKNCLNVETFPCWDTIVNICTTFICKLVSGNECWSTFLFLPILFVELPQEKDQKKKIKNELKKKKKRNTNNLQLLTANIMMNSNSAYKRIEPHKASLANAKWIKGMKMHAGSEENMQINERNVIRSNEKNIILYDDLNAFFFSLLFFYSAFNFFYCKRCVAIFKIEKKIYANTHYTSST